MKCLTIKEGMECVFMRSKGCTFNGGACHPVIQECEGCGKILENSSGRFCQVSPDPNSKWARGRCNLATHLKAAEASSAPVKQLNPLKASKRSARGLA